MTTWDFPTAFSAHGAEEAAAVARVLASDRLTMGPETEALEAELAAFHGRRHAVMVNSGSSANLIAVVALAHRAGDGWIRNGEQWMGDPPLEISRFAAPAIAWATTYAPPIQHGLAPLVVDVDDTWNAPAGNLVEMEWDKLSLLVTVPVLGNPAYLVDWQILATRLNIPLLVDACESIGAFAGKPPGVDAIEFGAIATVSFFYSHQISAWEGGAALTDDDDLARTMRLLRDHGNAGWGSAEVEEHYNFTIFGYNLRPVEIHAAVAREQLRKLPEMIAARRTNADLFRSLTTDLPIVHPRIEGTPSPFGLPFTVESRERRRALVAALREASIDARLPTGGSFTRHPYGAPWREANPTPNADRIHDTGLFLGCAPWPIPDLIEKAVKILKNTL
jgi:CDP-6-deoxy-D-xylo-4-hexulose-3-dehydrase